ncbi:hypothetical protein DFJ63DRAFT_333770 [Scheffersomyces coipomensis]|uniref:uncharacterized protein n=1 Tax=Scheffersomyces coipomensis TaxID=1788519 RepID=UPI00315D2550
MDYNQLDNNSNTSSTTGAANLLSHSNSMNTSNSTMPESQSINRSDSISSTTSNSTTKSGKKNIPLELTAYGTTPSGKPRLFVCQVCTRAFARLEHLRRHERSHTKEKPFSCGVCQRKFSRRDLLLRHAQKLHAGCSDAITRLRRKSIKRSSSMSNSGSNDMMLDDDDEDDEDDEEDDDHTLIDNSHNINNNNNNNNNNSNQSSKNNDNVEFNLNLFNHESNIGIPSTSSTAGNTVNNTPKSKSKSSKSTSKVSKSTPKNTSTSSSSNSTRKSSIVSTNNLQRQVIDNNRKKIMGRNRRGASFSAQSGANYAMSISEFSEMYPNSDNVEFSTPQLMPSTMNDEMSWLNNLSTIPGLSDNANTPMMRQNSISLNHENHGTPPINVSHHGSFSLASSTNTGMIQGNSNSNSHLHHSISRKSSNSMSQSESLNSINGFDNLSYMMPTATITNQELQNGVAAAQAAQAAKSTTSSSNNNNNNTNNTNPSNVNNNQLHEDPPNDFGYSFYDIPETVLSAKMFDNFNADLETQHHHNHQQHTQQQLSGLGPHQQQQQMHHMFKSLSPIKQELDDEIMEGDDHDATFQHPLKSHKTAVATPSTNFNVHNNNNNNNNSNTANANFDLNFLNDIDELTHEFDVNAKFMPNGYSFYGDNPSASSSGIETNSPQIQSPSLHYGPGSTASATANSDMLIDMNTLDHAQLLNIETTLDSSSFAQPQPPQPIQLQSQQQQPGRHYSIPQLQQQQQQASFNQFSNSQFVQTMVPPAQSNWKAKYKLSNFSKNKLFTNNLRHMINKSLSKYPISGIMTPTIPTNEKLEFYLSTFVKTFLTHFPFIHTSKLNEYEVMNMTANEDINNESSRVCLPLLIATIGALFSNNKNDSEHLYEASRRTIHIYLESRKNSVGSDNESSGSKKEKDSNSTINPLWLIQSLTLSVIYGLFSDNENNVYIVIRQLNALNSLVKTSIKSNRVILFSINGEDEEIFNQLNSTIHATTPTNSSKTGSNNKNGGGGSLFPNNFNDELKFKNNINIQSQIRIVFMIYRLTNFLLMMYNVPLTLSINDLNNLLIPNQVNETLWGFKNYQEFQEFDHKNNNNNFSTTTIDGFLSTGDKIIYKDLLLNLTKKGGLTKSSTVKQLNQLSKYGFICISHGLFEIRQYQEMKNIDISSILDYLTKFIPTTNTTKLQSQDFEKLDYALLVNFIKISSLIDFKLVKEQSWLRNFDELTKNFNKFLIDNNPQNANANINDNDYLKIIDCCLMIIKLVLFKSEDVTEEATNGGMFNTDFGFLNSNGSLDANQPFPQHSPQQIQRSHSSPDNNPEFNSLLIEDKSNIVSEKENSLVNFEKFIHLRIYEEFDNSTNSILSQMLFHVFTILAVFSIYIIRKNANNDAVNNSNDNSPDLLFELNHRFSMTLKLLDKVENFLKLKYNMADLNSVSSNAPFNPNNIKLENDFTNLYLFQGTGGSHNNGEASTLSSSDGSNNQNLEQTLNILKVGETVMNYLYDSNIKVSIFKKLSGSLAQIRKFLIDNESRILS